MQLQILHSLTIHAQPMVYIGILQTRVAFLNFKEAALIDACKDGSKWQSKNGALRPAPAATVGFAPPEFRQLSKQLHSNASAISRSNPGPR